MNLFYRKTRKLIKTPGLFFRDMMIKKYPKKEESNLKEVSGEKNKNIVKKTPIVQAKPSTVALGKQTIRSTKITDIYVDSFDRIALDSNLVLFESYSGKKITCNPYALYQSMRANEKYSDVQVIWVITKDTKIPEDVSADKRVTFVDYLSKEYAIALIKAKYLINNWIFPPFFIARENQIYINVWHGIPLKKLGLDIGHMGFDEGPPLINSAYIQRNYIQAAYVALSGIYAKEKTVDSYGYLGSKFIDSIFPGSPRLDVSLANNDDLRNILNIKEDRKILLFAPTWRGSFGNLSLDLEPQLEAIEAIVREFGSDFHILFSIHHGIKNKISKNILKNINIVPDDANINEILSFVDILISDYSSISLDFLALDRPLILYTPDLDFYEDHHGLYVSLTEIPAKVVKDISSLIEAVNAALKPSSFSNYERALSKFIPYEDGNASNRLLNYMFESGFDNKVKEGYVKKTLLIYPGALLYSGITSSFLSLVKSIDYDKLEVFVIIDTAFTDKNFASMENYKNIDQRCHIIFRAGGILFRNEEKIAYQNYQDPNFLIDDIDEALVSRAFKREALRNFGDRVFDVVIDFSGYSPYWSLLLAHVKSNNRVIYQHSDLYAEANSIHETRRRPQICAVFRSYKFYNRVVAVTKEILEVNKLGLSDYLVDGVIYTYCNNPIRPEDIRHKSNYPIGLLSLKAESLIENKNVIKYISLGRLSPEKNQMRLIKAFGMLMKKDNPNAVLFLIGDGPVRRDLEKEVKRLKIQDRVIFLGQMSNPYSILKGCDCLVLPSDYEGQGIVLLEAMTLGVPCIGMNIPAVRSILENGIGEIANLNDYDLYSKMAGFSRKRIGVDQFNADNYLIETMSQFYSNVCSFNLE